MRGRKPHSLTIAPADVPALQQIARSQTLPFFQVQRARIVLEMAHGGRTRSVAIEARCDETTVRRTCHRYERLGVPGRAIAHLWVILVKCNACAPGRFRVPSPVWLPRPRRPGE